MPDFSNGIPPQQWKTIEIDELQSYTAEELRDLSEAMVVLDRDGERRLAVLIPYPTFKATCDQMKRTLQAIGEWPIQ